MKCKAHTSKGKPCKAEAIRGGAVCRTHGGSAPQVKAAAALRLAALVDPAIDELTKLLKKSRIDSVRMAAVKDILDRTGHKPKDEVEISGKVDIAELLNRGRKRAAEGREQ